MGIFENESDFNKYKFFYAVSEYKSFSKAAENLHISQPAISHAVKELENQLNTKLFIRNNKNVVLTEDGEKLIHYVKKAFDNITMGENVIKEKEKKLTGTIRIGIYSHISLFLLPKIIKKFNLKYPDAKFYIYCTSNAEMLEKLRNRELDFVVLQYPIFINDNTFTEEILCEMDTCFFGNKEHYDLYMKNNGSLQDLSLILPTRGFPDINRLEQTLKKHNLVLKSNITSYTTDLTRRLVKQGLGIGWGIKKCIEKDIEYGTLYEIPVDFEEFKTKFSIAYDSNFINNTTSEFIKYFKEEVDKYI